MWHQAEPHSKSNWNGEQGEFFFYGVGCTKDGGVLEAELNSSVRVMDLAIMYKNT